MPTIADLEREVAELNERLRVTTALLAAMRAYEEKVGRRVREAEGVVVRERSRRAAGAMSDTERVASELMEQAGGPVQTGEVVKEMENRGLPVPGIKPVNVISARLSNNPRFKGRRGVGYWFADRPWPDEDNQTSFVADENEAPAGHAAGTS